MVPLHKRRWKRLSRCDENATRQALIKTVEGELNALLLNEVEEKSAGLSGGRMVKVRRRSSRGDSTPFRLRIAQPEGWWVEDGFRIAVRALNQAVLWQVFSSMEPKLSSTAGGRLGCIGEDSYDAIALWTRVLHTRNSPSRRENRGSGDNQAGSVA